MKLWMKPNFSQFLKKLQKIIRKSLILRIHVSEFWQHDIFAKRACISAHAFVCKLFLASRLTWTDCNHENFWKQPQKRASEASYIRNQYSMLKNGLFKVKNPQRNRNSRNFVIEKSTKIDIIARLTTKRHLTNLFQNH